MRSANASFSREREQGASAAHDHYSSSLLLEYPSSERETSLCEDGYPGSTILDSKPDAATETPHLVQEVMARRRMLAALEQEADTIYGSRRNSGVTSHLRATSPPIILSELQRVRAECAILTARLATADELRAALESEVAAPPPPPPNPAPFPRGTTGNKPPSTLPGNG